MHEDVNAILLFEQESDVPKAAESVSWTLVSPPITDIHRICAQPEASAEIAVAAKSQAPATVTEEAAPSTGESSSDTSGTFQESGEEGPTDLKAPREAAKVCRAKLY